MDAFYRAFDSRIVSRPIGRIDKVYFLGGDIALSGDGTSFAICHFEKMFQEYLQYLREEVFAYAKDLRELRDLGSVDPIVKEMFVVDYVGIKQPGIGDYKGVGVLPVDDILDWLEYLYKHFPIRFGIADQWSGAILEQLIQKRNIRRFGIINHTATINDSQYQLFSMLLHDKKMKLPDDSNIILPKYVSLENELLNLQVEHKPNKLIKVEAPPGKHDDRFDAIIRCLWVAFSHLNENKILTNSYGIGNLFNTESLVQKSFDDKNIKSEKQYELYKKRFHGNSASSNLRSKNFTNNRITKGRR
jgi:hypothetical protein